MEKYLGPTKANSGEQLVEDLLATVKPLFFALDVAPARGNNAGWIANSVQAETFDISAACSKEVAPPLYQLVDVKMRSHGALEHVPLGDYPLANDN